MAEAVRQGQKEGSFVLGFAGAIAAYGGFVIPQAYKYSRTYARTISTEGFLSCCTK